MAKRQSVPLFIAAAALAFHLFAGLAFIRASSPTFDETAHLAAAYSYLHGGRLMMSELGHPPLPGAIAALPLQLMRLNGFASHPYSVNGQIFSFGDLFLYNNSRSPDAILQAARLSLFLCWTALLAFFVWRFAADLYGPEAAGYAVAAAALMPALISNDALVTTDAGGAVFFAGAVWAARLCARAPRQGPRQFLLAAAAGALAGLAMASKFSMFVLPPLLAVLLAVDAWLARTLKPLRLLASAALLLGCAAVVVAAFSLGEPSSYVEGVRAIFTDLGRGRSSFALGRYSLGGVLWYFPLALLVKTPLAVLALASLCAWLYYREKGRGGDWLWLFIPPALFFAAALNSKAQIGYRHILPVYPFLAAAAGIGAAWLLKRRPLPLLAAVAVLCGSWAWLLWRTHPHYLAYFSELAGGPANGYKVLVDSNLDWGQELKTLAAELRARGNPPVVLSYFGTGRPESYGIRYTPLGVFMGSLLTGTGADVCAMDKVLLSVSATNLQGVYYPDKTIFYWLKERRPVFNAGYSLFLYDLTGDKDGLGRLAAGFDGAGRNAEAECLYRRAERLPGI